MRTFKFDLIAGITVALVAIPQSLAYAQLAGVPAYYGLYAALIPTIIGAVFGSSRQLSTGPVAMTSLLTAASVAPLAAHGTEGFYVLRDPAGAAVGPVPDAFGMLRMGVLLNFLSHPVLMGFINAAAIIIGLSQLPTMLGIPAQQSNHFLLDIWHVVTNIDTHARDVAGLRRHRRIAMLLALQKIRAETARRADHRGAADLGQLCASASRRWAAASSAQFPQGLPSFSIPPLDWHATIALLPAALRDRADQLHGGDVELQGDRHQDAHAVGRKPGTDRPGAGQGGGGVQPVDAGQRLVFALGAQSVGQRQDRPVVADLRRCSCC